MARLDIVGEVNYDKLVLVRTHMDRLNLIDKAVGALEEGQVLAMSATTGKLVKYDSTSADAKGAYTVYTGETLKEASATDFLGTTACFGTRVDKAKVKGIVQETDFEGLHKLYLAGILLEEVK